jgi:cell shape-determining protein MreC
MKPEAKKEFSKLAREVMDIVLDVAARRLEQTLAEVHNIKEQEHQDFRLQNDREWREKLDHVKAENDRLREILRLTQTYEKYASAVPAKETGK